MKHILVLLGLLTLITPAHASLMCGDVFNGLTPVKVPMLEEEGFLVADVGLSRETAETIAPLFEKHANQNRALSLFEKMEQVYALRDTKALKEFGKYIGDLMAGFHNYTGKKIQLVDIQSHTERNGPFWLYREITPKGEVVVHHTPVGQPTMVLPKRYVTPNQNLFDNARPIFMRNHFNGNPQGAVAYFTPDGLLAMKRTQSLFLESVDTKTYERFNKRHNLEGFFKQGGWVTAAPKKDFKNPRILFRFFFQVVD